MAVRIPQSLMGSPSAAALYLTIYGFDQLVDRNDPTRFNPETVRVLQENLRRAGLYNGQNTGQMDQVTLSSVNRLLDAQNVRTMLPAMGREMDKIEQSLKDRPARIFGATADPRAFVMDAIAHRVIPGYKTAAIDARLDNGITRVSLEQMADKSLGRFNLGNSIGDFIQSNQRAFSNPGTAAAATLRGTADIVTLGAASMAGDVDEALQARLRPASAADADARIKRVNENPITRAFAGNRDAVTTTGAEIVAAVGTTRASIKDITDRALGNELQVAIGRAPLTAQQTQDTRAAGATVAVAGSLAIGALRQGARVLTESTVVKETAEETSSLGTQFNRAAPPQATAQPRAASPSPAPRQNAVPTLEQVEQSVADLVASGMPRRQAQEMYGNLAFVSDDIGREAGMKGAQAASGMERTGAPSVGARASSVADDGFLSADKLGVSTTSVRASNDFATATGNGVDAAVVGNNPIIADIAKEAQEFMRKRGLANATSDVAEKTTQTTAERIRDMRALRDEGSISKKDYDAFVKETTGNKPVITKGRMALVGGGAVLTMLWTPISGFVQNVLTPSANQMTFGDALRDRGFDFAKDDKGKLIQSSLLPTDYTVASYQVAAGLKESGADGKGRFADLNFPDEEILTGYVNSPARTKDLLLKTFVGTLNERHFSSEGRLTDAGAKAALEHMRDNKPLTQNLGITSGPMIIRALIASQNGLDYKTGSATELSAPELLGQIARRGVPETAAKGEQIAKTAEISQREGELAQRERELLVQQQKQKIIDNANRSGGNSGYENYGAPNP